MNSSAPQRPAKPSLTVKVAYAVAEYRNIDPNELNPPLHRTIDTEALNSLFTSTKNGPHQGTVTFRYDGLAVTVSSDRRVEITPQERE